MDVLINVDRAYLKGLVVTVESLLLHARGPCRLHLAVEGFDCHLIDELRSQWQGHPRLESLDLMSTAISDTGVLKLANCKSLRKVWLPTENLSPAAVDRLQAALPSTDLGR